MFAHILAFGSDFGHLNLILLLGLAVLGGTIGAKVFQRFCIPQVVGYIIIGILVGCSVLNLVNEDTIQKLIPFNLFALGLIGFNIGGELKLEIFKKYGKQFFLILFAEGLTSFIIVSLLSIVAAQFFLNNWGLSVGLGLVLGAISSATAPAATVDVLWEYKTRGPLTRTILALVALDDGLALILFGFAASAAQILGGQSDGNLWSNILLPIWDIGGAVVIGVLMGLVLIFILKYVHEHDKILTFTLASVLLIIGLSITLEVDSILAAMALGATMTNGLPRRSHSTFELVEKFTPPIFVLFFVLVGARLQIGSMPMWILVLAVIYVFGRTGGKMLGAWFGARLSGADETVRKYLGLCLFSQAGVAVGLSIIAGQRFEGEIGQAVILVVTATTFLVQIIGPSCVKYAVTKAGEVGMNITEADLIQSYTAGDIMDTDVNTINIGTSLGEILTIFSQTDAVYYPVVDAQNRLMGKITITGIKETLAHQGRADWLVAFDLMEPVKDYVVPEKALSKALSLMDQYELDYMPVVGDSENISLVGLLDFRSIKRKINAEVLNRRKTSE